MPSADRPWTPRRVETELGRLADQLERIDTRKRELEARRIEVLRIGRTLSLPKRPTEPISYRTLAEWCRLTNTRVHQIIGPAPAG